MSLTRTRTSIYRLLILGVLLLIFSPLTTVAQSIPPGSLEADRSGQVIYLPMITKLYPPFIINSAWTSPGDSKPFDAFLREDKITYHISGRSSLTGTKAIKISWKQDGPCGAATLFDGTVNVDNGIWSHSFTANAPQCLGLYLNTLQVTYQDYSQTRQILFVVNNPSAVSLSDKPAFDKCNIPTLDKMNVWWDKSPYYSINLYIGGISRGCANTELTSLWVHEASKQGWSFLPTWVGPQAPCSKYKHKMSYTKSTAYQQGRKEADGAVDASARLGLGRQRTIFYNLEGYTSDDGSCDAAVTAFMQGWVERLHELGAKAGVYASPCRSNILDWLLNKPYPDNVWLAHWIKKTYDPDASVYGVLCMPDNVWDNHRRIRQYAGDHQETYGNVTLTIDSNIADGDVTLLPPDIDLAPTQISKPALPIRSSQLMDMQIVDGGEGWVLKDGMLLWTSDGGEHWSNITPERADRESLLDTLFINKMLGWAVIESLSGDIRIFRTDNSGGSWFERMNLDPLSEFDMPVDQAFLHFLDRETGWIAFKLETGSNFDLGELYGTTDGGETWKKLSLPGGNPVQFEDKTFGWTQVGLDEKSLYQTRDGGKTWYAVDDQHTRANEINSEIFTPKTSDRSILTDNSPLASAGGEIVAVKSEIWSQKYGWIIAEVMICSENGSEAEPVEKPCEIIDQLFSTSDGGAHWEEITP